MAGKPGRDLLAALTIGAAAMNKILSKKRAKSA
jgi:hypothetical protein